MAILDLRSSILDNHPPGSKSMKRSVTFVLSLTSLLVIRCRRIARADGVSIGPGRGR